jgi:probable HAF family extracellular repeat protein
VSSSDQNHVSNGGAFPLVSYIRRYIPGGSIFLDNPLALKFFRLLDPVSNGGVFLEGGSMTPKFLGVVVAVAFLGASSPVCAQGGWTFTTVDDPAAINGTNGTYAQGINDSGQVVGYSYDTAGNAHGFSKTGGDFMPLNYPEAPQSFAQGVNNKGDVVGWYNDSSHNHGFLYSGGVYVGINHPSAILASISAVPEPSTWAMMLIGFAGLSFVFRQSRRKIALA